MAGRWRLAAWGLIIIVASLDGFAGDRGTGVEALGLVTGTESVWVNNQAALPRMAVFGGDVVQTGKGSLAIVTFRSGSTAALVENSEVALGWDLSPTALNLRQGAMVVRSSSSQSTRVSVLGAAVTVQGESGFPAICRIAAVGRSAAVFNDGGHVEIQGAGGTLILPKGKFVQLEAGRPQGAGHLAGKVTAAIPEENVLHVALAQTKPVTLKIKDDVLWEDLVSTLKTGRVRIELQDGSALNIGARSVMKITKHDATSQQTELEMTVGRLRGDVTKITKSGGSFQIKTQTAVIGVVGTVLVISATAKFTRVWCLEGTLTVHSINAAVAGTVTLHAGEFTSVARGAPPVGAVHFSPGQVQVEVNQTAVSGPGAPGVPAAAVSNVASNAMHAGTAAAGATGATASGVAIGAEDAARGVLATTTTTLTATAGAAAAATSAANATTTIATSVGTIASTLTPVVVISVSVPCGCQ